MSRRSKDGAWYNGMWFAKDHKTGYYLNSTNRKRLHRYVYETERGPIPKGYEVHHIDFNKDNNSIENLKLLRRGEHQSLHASLLTEEQREWRRNNLAENARPKANEWHASPEGIAWHAKHAREDCAKWHEKVDGVCENCGKNFIGTKTQRFCSNACKSAWRRKTGVDNVEVTCAICGKTLIRSKFELKHKKEFACAGSCNAYLVARRKKENAMARAAARH